MLNETTQSGYDVSKHPKYGYYPPCTYLCKANIPNSNKSIYPTIQAAKRREEETNSSVGPLVYPLTKAKPLYNSTNETNDQCIQTDKEIKITKKHEPNVVIQRDYLVNPRVQTTYQQHFNATGDIRLGYCDNRSIDERYRYFKSCQKLQDDMFQRARSKGASQRYSSNYNQRISEYMAETSYIGGAIMKSGIHNHFKCPRRCTHFITLK